MIRKYISILGMLCVINMYSQSYKTYKVFKIDSTSNNYIITLKKGNKKSIVLSPKKDTIIDKSKIEIGKNYKLCLLKTVLTKQIHIDKSSSLAIEGKTIWKSGDDFDVYFVDNLVGLYYIKPN